MKAWKTAFVPLQLLTGVLGWAKQVYTALLLFETGNLLLQTDCRRRSGLGINLGRSDGENRSFRLFWRI
jgi:hypothetical protein